MQRTAFYRLLLLLPNLVFIPAFVASRLMHLNISGPGPLEFPRVVIFRGAVPYAVLSAILVWWMRGKSVRRVRLAVATMPVYFALAFGVWVAGRDMMEGSGIDWFVVLAFQVVIILGGYLYVALIEAMRWVGETLGWFSRVNAREGVFE